MAVRPTDVKFMKRTSFNHVSLCSKFRISMWINKFITLRHETPSSEIEDEMTCCLVMAVAHRGERWVQRSGEIISRQEGPKKTPRKLCYYASSYAMNLTQIKREKKGSQSQRLLNSVIYFAACFGFSWKPLWGTMKVFVERPLVHNMTRF
jgi:hypothetical protein